jgi:UDP-2-acetamido-3-amino-2,3-dideoxy-glucuronate N-acetyltransferase
MGEAIDGAAYSAHETAIIDSGAKIGHGTRIWHWVHVVSTAEIGANCSLGQNVYVGHARIGNNVKIQNNVSVYDAVVLEDDVFCGPSMVFTNVINPRSHIPRKHEFKTTLVKRGATIGANAVIVCGNTIGSYSMIGAGAVVTRDVPDFALVVGNPARRIGWVCECGIRLTTEQGHGRCRTCGGEYEVTGETMRRLR